MATVQGLGGVFVYSNDSRRLSEWYRTKLGIEFDSHPNGSVFYVVFRTRDLHSQRIRENPIFSIMQADETLPSARGGFMVNFRVDDLGTLLALLRERGVDVEDKTSEWEGGKHGWFRDLDGNRVELYEELFAGNAPES